MFVVRPAITKTNFRAIRRQSISVACDRPLSGQPSDPFRAPDGRDLRRTRDLLFSEKPQDEVALGSSLQTLLLNMLEKDFLLFSHGCQTARAKGDPAFYH
jgi:hypothetical protein